MTEKTEDLRDALAKALCAVEMRSKAATIEEVVEGVERWTRHRYEAERLMVELVDYGVALAVLSAPQEAKSAAKVVPVSYEASASCSHGVCPSGCSHLMWECAACSCEGGWGVSRERLEELAAQHECPSAWGDGDVTDPAFEALEQKLWKHQPVLSMEDGSIRGCQCLDRVFYRGTEDWGTHLAEVFKALSRAAAPEPELPETGLEVRDGDGDLIVSGEHRKVLHQGMYVCDSCVNDLGLNVRWDRAGFMEGHPLPVEGEKR